MYQEVFLLRIHKEVSLGNFCFYVDKCINDETYALWCNMVTLSSLSQA